MKVNKTLWNLEDSARMFELGDKYVAETKRNIDSNNQDRNNLIRKIDVKLSVIQKLLLVIKEDDLKVEYREKEKIILDQIKNIGQFYDRYMEKLVNKEVFFEIQHPVKIYNDLRIRKYIKYLGN
ncbi:MAG: hypothetical protein A3G45_00450 [Candidatus Staskawiczbacteria bacterium RIFCSPLOWO2_12_FULL_37_15]|uniref:Uncharacterized protein n=1 Tax=Candidatus Staskawiczbacteria bacterium RIFCSPLOWO2_12_FULL_37_15 TaxID=1802218 RepID=A0A1G2IR76_9BACT|nr:MAG: hypothetical protein A3G45_00450 [Candidatus Staskawiczbacteria bacterium RIFCSPLOWO2_12_FULL_37_15]